MLFTDARKCVIIKLQEEGSPNERGAAHGRRAERQIRRLREAAGAQSLFLSQNGAIWKEVIPLNETEIQQGRPEKGRISLGGSRLSGRAG